MTEALLEGQNQVLLGICADRPLAETLDAVCRLIESHSPGTLASVLLLDDQGEHLLHGAGPSLPAEYSQAVHGLTIGPTVGSCGAAAATGQECLVRDIATHPNWAPFKALALAHGLASCWSMPIRGYDGRVIGTFAMYHRVPKLPDLADRKLADFTEHLVSIALNRHRERQALGLAERR